MLVDSHCHLHSLDLADFNNDMNEVMQLATDNDVQQFLCVCIELSDYPALEKLAAHYASVYISVGVHPNTAMEPPVTADTLCALAQNPACIAIGETGLDYYRTTENTEQRVQKTRFRQHIQAALLSSKPLIVHTRQAAQDTLDVMAEENAQNIGGVMHCFSEPWDIAKRAMDLNFYISFSGVITFKNATALQEVVKQVPLDRILIETDSPYLAPVPFRGKQNHPALVKYVAEAVAQLKGISYEEVARQTTNNFYQCFRIPVKENACRTI